MKHATLTRFETSDQGTIGEIVLDGFHCFTIELPWRQNKTGKSCIPAGRYVCLWQYSPKHNMCYHLQDVPGRTDVQIHSANWAGDSERGYKVQLLGCIAPGRQIGELEGQTAALNSKDALKAFEDACGREQVILTIVWKDGESPEANNAEEIKSYD